MYLDTSEILNKLGYCYQFCVYNVYKALQIRILSYHPSLV